MKNIDLIKKIQNRIKRGKYLKKRDAIKKARYTLNDKEEEITKDENQVRRKEAKKLCGIFSQEFKEECWTKYNLCIRWTDDFDFNGEGFFIEVHDNKINIYMKYRATWHDMIFEYLFKPTCIEDVKREAKRLKKILILWKETKNVKN